MAKGLISEFLGWRRGILGCQQEVREARKAGQARCLGREVVCLNTLVRSRGMRLGPKPWGALATAPWGAERLGSEVLHDFLLTKREGRALRLEGLGE